MCRALALTHFLDPCGLALQVAQVVKLGAAHVAAAKSTVITKVDLDTPSLGEYDPVSSGVRFNDAEIVITDAPGLGITAVEGLEQLDVECR